MNIRHKGHSLQARGRQPTEVEAFHGTAIFFSWLSNLESDTLKYNSTQFKEMKLIPLVLLVVV